MLLKMSAMFAPGSLVFAKFDADGCWYACEVNKYNAQQKLKTCEITWFEGGETSVIRQRDLISPENLLRKGLEIGVMIPENLNFYEDLIYERTDENGMYICRSPDGTIHTVAFGDIMVNPANFKKLEREEKMLREISEKVVHEVSPKNQPIPKILKDWNFLITASKRFKHSLHRCQLEKKISEMGGLVWNTFSSLYDTPGERCLLAQSYCRTPKYIQCLAADIPCISTKWIFEIWKLRKLTEFSVHLLPTGISLFGEKRLLSWKPRKSLFSGLRIALHGSTEFLDVYYALLKSANAIPRALERGHIGSVRKLQKFGVIVVESLAVDFLDKLISTSSIANLTVVNQEWIVESVIHGTKLPYDAFLLTNNAPGIKNEEMT